VSELSEGFSTIKTERPRQRARTRAKIERAARRLFVNGGYFTVSIADIVSAAGLSRAVFYLHFRDKRDLLESVVRYNMKVQQRVLTRTNLPANPTDDDLRRWVTHNIDGVVRSMDGVRLVNLGTFIDPAFGTILYQSQNEIVLELVKRNPAFGVIDDAGGVRADRFAEISLILYELGQVALAAAYASLPSPLDLTVDLLVARTRGFIDRAPR
jgi:AcrR family transcriptional regulator